eukprot:CAMPEP_0176074032 /NCGR_PEP_ID=MMETSP0120_2-20121206/36994_1 /TAXON_ID=160619 /ORGANISM="Kryptoperidinium foliaceum, Strain CCMP 1326" /LENGTH=358 /DNA_ID=CAMNT_0017407721 /DNA_START=30 /DNA_END=1107 /DNA_ORIENTATION=+
MGQHCATGLQRERSAGFEDDLEQVLHTPKHAPASPSTCYAGSAALLMKGGFCMTGQWLPSDAEAVAPFDIDATPFKQDLEDDAPCAYMEEPAEAVAEADDFEATGFREVEDLRWAPSCPDAEDDMDPRRWAAMMSTMDMFITPLERGGVAASSSASPPSSPGSRATSSAPLRGIGEEAMREAAFEQLRSGRPLYTLPKHFRADKEIVLAAIGTERQYCYDYVASELRENDRDVVQAFVCADGSILERCSERLRSDRQLVRMALRTCSEALSWAPKSLQCDKELKAIAAARAKEEQSLLKRFEAKVCAPMGKGGVVPAEAARWCAVIGRLPQAPPRTERARRPLSAVDTTLHLVMTLEP